MPEAAPIPTHPKPIRRDSESYGNSIELKSADSFAGSVAAGGFCGTDSHYKLYVVGRFSKPYKSSSFWQDDSILTAGKSAQGKHTGAWVDFGGEREVMLKVGISFVSEAGAMKNLAERDSRVGLRSGSR